MCLLHTDPTSNASFSVSISAIKRLLETQKAFKLLRLMTSKKILDFVRVFADAPDGKPAMMVFC